MSSSIVEALGGIGLFLLAMLKMTDGLRGIAAAHLLDGRSAARHDQVGE